jgi:hypothetical protein
VRGLLLFLFLLLPVSVYAQAARWVDVQPVRTVALTGTAGDIQSQLPAGHRYSDPDVVTTAHETTHGINARIRNSFRAKNGFYVLNQRGFICPSPRFTLRQLAQRIPKDKRGKVLYPLYMVQAQRYWNDTPLYCLDECVAYLNGSIVGVELGRKERSLYSFDCALELWVYVMEAQRMAKESGYEHQEEFDDFLYQLHRDSFSHLIDEYRKLGWRQ